MVHLRSKKKRLDFMAKRQRWTEASEEVRETNQIGVTQALETLMNHIPELNREDIDGFHKADIVVMALAKCSDAELAGACFIVLLTFLWEIEPFEEAWKLILKSSTIEACCNILKVSKENLKEAKAAMSLLDALVQKGHLTEH